VTEGPRILSSGGPHVGQPWDNIRQLFVFDRNRCLCSCIVVKLCASNQKLKFVRSGRLADGGSKRQNVQGDQKVSVHLKITIQKATINVQSVLRESLDIY
jgi:hypothetical protein